MEINNNHHAPRRPMKLEDQPEDLDASLMLGDKFLARQTFLCGVLPHQRNFRLLLQHWRVLSRSRSVLLSMYL